MSHESMWTTMKFTEFLTHRELVEITGRERASGQIDWLNKNGWTFATNAAGRPIVSRLHARERLGVTAALGGGTMAHVAQPDFSALG